MDEQNDNDTVAVSSDNQADDAVNIQVKTASESPSNPGPIINDIQAPPKQESTVEDDTAEENDASTDEVAETVPEDTQNNSDETSSEDSLDETEPDAKDEPVMKQAPEAEELQEETESSTVTTVDPFMKESEDSVATAVPAPATTVVESNLSNNQPTQPHEHRNNKKFAIIITLIVTLLLAGALVYVYMSAQDNTTETTKSTTDPNTQQVAEIVPATSTDVDKTLSDIDQTIQSIDDEADLNETAISDATLGL